MKPTKQSTHTSKPQTQVFGEVQPYSITGSLPLVRSLQDNDYDVQLVGYGLSSKCVRACVCRGVFVSAGLCVCGAARSQSTHEPYTTITHKGTTPTMRRRTSRTSSARSRSSRASSPRWSRPPDGLMCMGGWYDRGWDGVVYGVEVGVVVVCVGFYAGGREREAVVYWMT